MTRERYIRLFAGTMVLASAMLAYFVHINWIWLAAFVGANLFQFSLTQWCPLDAGLKMLGVKSCAELPEAERGRCAA
jgi:hypothetical protein